MFLVLAKLFLVPALMHKPSFLGLGFSTTVNKLGHQLCFIGVPCLFCLRVHMALKSHGISAAMTW